MSRRLLLVTLLGASACSAAPPPSTDSDVAADSAAPTDRRHRVVVVGVDGLRPDGLTAASTPVLDAWLAEGALTLTGSTHLTGVTSSGPGWATILYGLEVEDHGVGSNSDLGDARERGLQNFVGRAHDAGLGTAAVFHWVGLGALVGADHADVFTATADDPSVGTDAAALIEEGRSDLIFLHHDDVDHAGHATGFSAANPDYLAAIEQVDASVAHVRTAIAARTDEAWMMLLVTDHGGKGTDHGVPSPDTRTIPLGVVAPGVSLGADALEGASQLDVAATALTWLGVAVGETAGRSWIDAGP